jgi:hypothetical protein
MNECCPVSCDTCDSPKEEHWEEHHGSSSECEAARSITHKNERFEFGIWETQCVSYDTKNTDPVTDDTVTIKDCDTCKAAMEVRFGRECGDDSGDDCQHCAGMLDAVARDCDGVFSLPKDVPDCMEDCFRKAEEEYGRSSNNWDMELKIRAECACDPATECTFSVLGQW